MIAVWVKQEGQEVGMPFFSTSVADRLKDIEAAKVILNPRDTVIIKQQGLKGRR